MIILPFLIVLGLLSILLLFPGIVSLPKSNPLAKLGPIYPFSTPGSKLERMEERTRQLEIATGLRYPGVDAMDRFILETERKLHPGDWMQIKCHSYTSLAEGTRNDCNRLIWVQRTRQGPYEGIAPEFKGACPKCKRHRTYRLNSVERAKVDTYVDEVRR